MALRFPLCLFNRHAPLRARVKWDGLNFVGTCRFCKRDIRKQHHGGWQKEWMDAASGKSGPFPLQPGSLDGPTQD
jgi:hypothetical protein